MTEGNEKTYSQKEIEAEKANAQHFKQLYEEIAGKFKGFDPEDYKKTKEELAAVKIKGSVGSEEEIKQRIAEAVGEEKKRLESAYNEEKKARESIESELKRERVTKTIMQKAAEACTSDGLELLTQVFERDGAWDNGQVVFKDAKGNIRYSPSDATKPMNTDEYLGELKTKYPSAFVAPGKAGAKDGITKINGGSATEYTSLSQLAKLPSREQKAILNKMAVDDPKALSALLSKPN